MNTDSRESDFTVSAELTITVLKEEKIIRRTECPFKKPFAKITESF